MLEPPSTPPDRLVFVYGTLRRGDVRDINQLHPTPRFVGMATVAGVLYDLGPYPGMVLGGQSGVVGEVYEVSPELERVLDQIEEVWPQQTGEYHKREVTVLSTATQADEWRELRCFIYEIDPDRTKGCPVIAGGDWLAGRRPHR